MVREPSARRQFGARLRSLAAALTVLRPVHASDDLGPPTIAQAVTPPRDTVILLQRGGCERRCAVYRVVLFGDGTGVFDGEYYVDRPGVVRLRMTVQRISAFIEKAIGSGFFDMRPEYGISDSTGCWSFDNDDAPIAVITISAAGHAKTVVHHHRCIGGDTNRLTVPEDDVDKIVNAASLIRGGERTK